MAGLYSFLVFQKILYFGYFFFGVKHKKKLQSAKKKQFNFKEDVMQNQYFKKNFYIQGVLEVDAFLVTRGTTHYS
jgi:hypothetical protein